MQMYRYERTSAFPGMTYAVQLLLILNVAAFVIEKFGLLPLRRWMALEAGWWRYLGVWELVTYQFVHAGPGHLFSNMLGLFFLGPETERTIGTNRFFALYLLSGVLGGLGWSLLSPLGVQCIGASGAVFGVLGAYAALYPNRELMLIFFPFVPIKAWIFVLILAVYELTHMLGLPGGPVANAAHLGGGVAGYVYALTLQRPFFFRRLFSMGGVRRRRDADPGRIDRILDKARTRGIHSLTRRERDELRRAGRS